MDRAKLAAWLNFLTPPPLRRKLNLLFLAILVAVVVVLGAGVHVVHGIQVQRKASALLDLARGAELNHDLARVAELLGWYLQIEPEHGPTWKWYARVLDQSDFARRERDRIFLVHEEALRYFPEDWDLEHRCAELALELSRYPDAEGHLKKLLERAEKQSPDQRTAAERAEVEDLVGQTSRGLNNYDDAEQWFRRAIQHDPGLLTAYDHLARLRRTELRRNASADAAIREMVVKNPQVGRAYVYRWRYFHEFAPPADPGDLRQALMLGPDDPEVIATAAVASERQKDIGAARRYWQKGVKLDPKNLTFALGLAGLETQERHLDRAEEVLRQAFQANPSLDLAFALAETLILEDKIDGTDQASDYMARLRAAGLGDSYVRYLEARILFERKQWDVAARDLELAREGLRFDTRRITALNLMLAECYRRLGSDEQRLVALEQVAESERAPDKARIAYARALARAGKFDKAIAIVRPLAERQPELRLEVVRFMMEMTRQEPSEQRDWPAVERELSAAEKALPQKAEQLVLLRVDLLEAQDRLADARSLLSQARAKDPRNLQFRLGLARLSQRNGAAAAALQILDQAEKDLGISLDLQLARLGYWEHEGGGAARAAVAKMAETRRQVPETDRPTFLDRLAWVELRLGEPSLAREHWRELAGMRPADLEVLTGLLDLAVQAGDYADAKDLVAKIRSIEGERGTRWRFGEAACLLAHARQGATKELEACAHLAAQISELRPDWWGSSISRRDRRARRHDRRSDRALQPCH